MKTLEMLTPEQTDARLRQYEASFVVNRPGNPVWRYDTAVVSSNSPCEDDSVAAIRVRGQGTGGGGPSCSPGPC